MVLTKQTFRASLPELYSARTRMRKLRPEDGGRLRQLLSDPLVVQYVNRNNKPPEERALRLVQQIHTSAAALEALHYVITLREHETVIGLISYQHWNERNGQVQIGYILERDYWGQGLASEIVKEWLALGFSNLGFKRVEGRCHEQNGASARVLLKNGMKLDRKLGYHGIGNEGTIVEVYGINAEEFITSNEGTHQARY